MTESESKWFEAWFNSPYYHLLYKHRSQAEAALFIDNICEYLELPPHIKVLDMACGKGRHALHLHSKGFHTVGLDLSQNNIMHTKRFENPYLQFHVHDMRLPYANNYFDVVFNLFTSFGYFEKQEDNERVIHAVYENLKHDGIFVFDFLNIEYIRPHIPKFETKYVGDITFHTHKYIENETLVKTIDIEDKDGRSHFKEHIKNYHLDDLKLIFQMCGFTIKSIFGNYHLSPFELEKSPRIIIIAQKK